MYISILLFDFVQDIRRTFPCLELKKEEILTNLLLSPQSLRIGVTSAEKATLAARHWLTTARFTLVPHAALCVTVSMARCQD